MTYADRLKNRLEVTGSALCVGLDPRPDSTEGGAGGIAEFLRRVVGETVEYAAAFKPNMAYFEAMGLRGVEILEQLLEEMPDEVPVIWTPSGVILERPKNITHGHILKTGGLMR